LQAAVSQSEAEACAGAITTVQRAISAFAYFLAGFAAGEGCFSGTSNGNRFIFEVGLGASDRQMCELFRFLLGIGHLYDSPRRQADYDDESSFRTQALRELLDVVVPFMDAHLPPSYKRKQYLAWRERLLDYWEHRAKRVRPCTVEGCEKPRRAHGLCRQHLYSRLGV
jgi:LAGLIDADG endonuclease